MNVAEIHALYAERIYNLCLTVLRDTASAEDATQETFLEVLRTQSPPEPEHFRAWLYQVAYRTALRARRKSPSFVALPSQLSATGESMENLMLHNEQIAKLRLEIDSLDPALKDPLVLRYQHDLSFREISTVLGEPEGTVSRRVHEARQELKQRLAGLAFLPNLEALLPRIPMAPVPPSLARRLAPPITPATAAPLFWSLIAAAAAILLVLALAARKHDDTPTRIHTLTKGPRVGSDPAVAAGENPSTLRPAISLAPARAATATFRMTVTDLPGDEVELQVLHRINLVSFRDGPTDLERPAITHPAEGTFESVAPCTEPSLFAIHKWRQGYLSEPWTRWVIAHPGETVTLDLNYTKEYPEYEARDVLLAEMARLRSFGGVRATFHEPGDVAKIAFRFKGQPLHQRHWPMLFWEGDRFLLLPLPPGPTEFKRVDACCEQDLAAQVNGGEIAEGGRLEHRPIATSFLSGVVLDPAGHPVVGATLGLADESGRNYTAKSAEAGRFTFEKMAVDLKNPKMSVRAPGFPIRANLAVALNQQNLVIQLQQMLRHRFLIADAPEGLAVAVKEFEGIGTGVLDVDPSAWDLSRVGEVPATFELRIDFAKAQGVAKVRLMFTAPGYYGLELGTYLEDGGETTVPIDHLQKRVSKDK